MIVEFQLNEPQIVALENLEGYAFMDRYNAPRVRYKLVDGRALFVDPATSQRIRALELRAGETFTICKRRDGRRNVWAVWLTPESEKARAESEKPVIAASLKAAFSPAVPSLLPPSGRKAPVLPFPEPRPEVPGTGTYGPAPRLAAVTRVPEKIPFNVAFREAVRVVQKGLEAAGDQWNDESRQAAVATILIAASKAGWLTVWERPAA